MIRAIPAFVGFTVIRAIPCAFVRVVRLIPGAVTRTRARTNGLPFDSSTRATIVVVLPTVSCRGVALNDKHVAGGVSGPITSVGADAVLSALLVSGSFPTTTTVFVIVPVAVGVTTIVIVTTAPAAIDPIAQLTTPAACEQVPCVEVADTNVTVAGS